MINLVLDVGSTSADSSLRSSIWAASKPWSQDINAIISEAAYLFRSNQYSVVCEGIRRLLSTVCLCGCARACCRIHHWASGRSTAVST